MSDCLEVRVRTIIAEEINAPPENVRAESVLRLGDLVTGPLSAAAKPYGEDTRLARGDDALSWRRLYAIADRIERAFGVRFDLGQIDTWTSVGDVIDATEAAIARTARRGAAA